MAAPGCPPPLALALALAAALASPLAPQAAPPPADPAVAALLLPPPAPGAPAAQRRAWRQAWRGATLKTAGGLRYVTLAQGNGTAPRPGDLLWVAYRGWLPDGEPFADSRASGEPLLFHHATGQVIPGWDTLLSRMRPGALALARIPAAMAYGDRPPAGIPPGADLYFELELLRAMPGAPLPDYRAQAPALSQSPTGLRYALMDTAGSGEEGRRAPQTADIALFHYTGRLPDGRVFASTHASGDPEKLALGSPGVIAGLDQALRMLPPGARGHFAVPAKLAYGRKGRPTAIPGNTQLLYDIDMLEVRPAPVIERFRATADTLDLGHGVRMAPAGEAPRPAHSAAPPDTATPAQGATVALHYSGYLPNGEMFDSSVARDQFILFTIGQGEVIPGLDTAARHLRPGQKATVLIPWQQGYGTEGNPPLIPPRCDLLFDIELLFIIP